MRQTLTALLVCACGVLCVPGSAAQQEPAAPDRLRPILRLLGTWEGTSQGEPGAGQVRRVYTAILGGRFVRGESRSTYPPQAKNPKGEVHEDISIFSFDRARGSLVLRQFHVEGFVNQYLQDTSAPDGTVVFTSESIENIPPGWRARETYRFSGADAFEEVFEL